MSSRGDGARSRDRKGRRSGLPLDGDLGLPRMDPDLVWTPKPQPTEGRSPRGSAARRGACLVLLLAGAACSHARPLPADTGRKLLPFLEDGKTTAEEILLQLGIPTARFEGERILTYRLVMTEDGNALPVSRHLSLSWSDDPRLGEWKERSTVSLVLVFDERHVLVRHGVVQVR